MTMQPATTTPDLYTLISVDVDLKKTAGTKGGEYHGACPFCGGRDRLAVWPNATKPGWWCRQCERGGDAIQYLREQGMSFADACAQLGRRLDERPRTERPAPAPEACEPPCAAWRAAGGAFALFAQQQLHAAPHALDYLRGRGLTDKTIHAYGLGYNPAGRWSERAKWGIARDDSKDARYPDQIWLPQGIVIPQRVDGVLWKIEIRQDNPAQPDKRYKTVTSSSNVLAGADSLQPGKPFMLVEGPIDWLCVAQAAADLCGVGRVGTSGARRVRWLTRLALASVVLVSLDADAPGDTASKYWLDALPNARRWRPYYADPAQMAQDGGDVRAWVAAGLNLKARRLDEFSTEIVGTADGAQLVCLLWDDTTNAVIGRYASEAAAIAEARRLCGVTL